MDSLRRIVESLGTMDELWADLTGIDYLSRIRSAVFIRVRTAWSPDGSRPCSP